MSLTWQQWATVASGTNKPGAAVTAVPWGNDVVVFSIFPNGDIQQPSGEVRQNSGNPFADPANWGAWNAVFNYVPPSIPLGSPITAIPWGNRLALFVTDQQGTIQMNIGYPQTNDWLDWTPVAQGNSVLGATVTAVVWGNSVVLFMADSTGGVYQSSGDPNEGNWGTWTLLPNVTVQAGSPITAIPWGNRLTLFVTDQQGTIQMNIGYPQTNNWVGWALVAQGTSISGATVTAVAWGNGLVLFMADSNGGVCQSSGDPNEGNWEAWTLLPILDVKVGSPITALPNGNQLALFVTDQGGTIYTNTGYPQIGNWVSWTSVGQGTFSPGGTIIAVPWINSVPALFTVDINGTIYTTSQTAETTDDPEQKWWGEFLFGGSAEQIAVGQNEDGHLEVFYVGTNNNLYHRWQLVPGGLVWSAETQFPGDSAKQIAVGRNDDGRLEIFYVGTNNNLYHNWQTTPNGPWAGETPFPASAQQVAVGSNADGRLEVFYVGTNNVLYHNWQTTPGGNWAVETAFPGNSAQQVVVGGNTNGELEIFYVGTDNNLYHNWQIAPNAWAGENQLSGASANYIAWGRNLDGRQEVFYVGTNSNLYHNWEVAPGSGWNGEVAFSGDSAAQIAVGQNGDGRLEIFYVGTNGNLYHNYQLTAGSATWKGESQMKDNAAATYVVAAPNSNNQLEVFYVGTNYDLYHNWQLQPFGGFGSNANYFFYDSGLGCQPLVKVSVTINVTEDIVCQAVEGGPQIGFGFQLNCYSPANYLSAGQQYGFSLYGSTIVGWVDNWPVQGGNIINHEWNMGSLPGKVPAGYRLVITLENDTDNNVTGALYQVFDNDGNTVSIVDQKLADIGGDSSKIAPIIAFQMNLVGPVNGEAAVLSSGAGTFVYQATNAMTTLMSSPQCAELHYSTAETANSLYDSPTAANPTFTVFNQGFHVSLKEALARKPSGIMRARTVYTGPAK